MGSMHEIGFYEGKVDEKGTLVDKLLKDTKNNIVKVDNTDYYNFLEDGELITDATILDTELTDYFARNNGSCK